MNRSGGWKPAVVEGILRWVYTICLQRSYVKQLSQLHMPTSSTRWGTKIVKKPLILINIYQCKTAGLCLFFGSFHLLQLSFFISWRTPIGQSPPEATSCWGLFISILLRQFDCCIYSCPTKCTEDGCSEVDPYASVVCCRNSRPQCSYWVHRSSRCLPVIMKWNSREVWANQFLEVVPDINWPQLSLATILILRDTVWGAALSAFIIRKHILLTFC